MTTDISYHDLIARFIENCGDIPKMNVSDTEWWIIHGETKVHIFLTSNEDDADIIVASNLFKMKEKNFYDLAHYILLLNGSFMLKGATFGIRHRKLLINYTRPVNGLDEVELEWMIASIAVLGDEYRDSLKEKFSI